MKKFLILSTFTFLTVIMAFSQTEVTGLLTENQKNPIGLDTKLPRFSWQLISNQRNITQHAYEIKVTSGKTTIWNSGKTNSDQSIHVPYLGPALESEKRYSWTIRVWDNMGLVSKWSSPAYWQTGFLSISDWKAQWIEPGRQDSVLRLCPLMRREFSLSKKVATATAYITAHGMYEAVINGKRVGDAYLTPGWTSYNNRLQYQVYDVTPLLSNGKNAVGVTLGNGWYRGYIGYSGHNNAYGKDIALLLQIDITFNDGTKESIFTDPSWRSSTGSIQSSEIYNGEQYDARIEKPGWTLPNYNDKDWDKVIPASFPNQNLVATYNEPIRKHEIFEPVSVIKTPKGETVLDFGQNLVGWVIFNAQGKRGDTIIVSHAEVLDKKGNFYTDNLRGARAKDSYIMSGNRQETFEPHFTFHGFRFIKVEGYPGDLEPEDFKAIALYSDMEPTGKFSCSDSRLNQLQHNIQWGQRGNFLDVPTDCPQRDERLGWTGDAQAFSRTAAFNMNVNNFFAKWLKDVSADQGGTGAVPRVVPNILGKDVGVAGWSDVATIVPWNVYLAYGDKRVLEDQYISMKRWVDYISSQSKNDLWKAGGYGDWLAPDPFKPGHISSSGDATANPTDVPYISQCFYAWSTQLLIKAARVLGNKEDIDRYTSLEKKIKEAFLREYMTPDSRAISNTQTAYVLALQFDMLPEAMQKKAAERLVELIKNNGNHLGTGFLGTPYLNFVLTRFGYTDLAYKILYQEDYPSWLYPLKMGATTIWERWDGIKPDSSFQDAGMNSFNHYAYGAIGDWMYREIAGLDTREEGPAFKQIVIKPHPGGNLTKASAELKTYYGEVSSSWEKIGDKMNMDVTIPPNTTATVYFPGTDLEKLTESGKAIGSNPDFQVAGKENGYIKIKLGSGKYLFSGN